MDRVAIGVPLLVGVGVVVATILVHGGVLAATLGLVRRERARGSTSQRFLRDLAIVGAVVLLALLAHLVEIVAWAALFVLLGEFQDPAVAVYHSAVNYTTLGYGDIVMSPAWKALGPIEATDGMLMFGVSTAMIFAVIHRLVLDRFADLRD